MHIISTLCKKLTTNKWIDKITKSVILHLLFIFTLGGILMIWTILIVLLIITATIFGIFAQGMAYSLYDFFEIYSPFHYLVGITLTSLAFYVVALVIVLILYIRKRDQRQYFLICLWVGFLIAFATSNWSVFVMLMWWG